jgi:hypothetical protein
MSKNIEVLLNIRVIMDSHTLQASVPDTYLEVKNAIFTQKLNSTIFLTRNTVGYMINRSMIDL